VSACKNKRDVQKDEHPRAEHRENGWIQIGHHTMARAIVQGRGLVARRAVAGDWGRPMSIPWTGGPNGTFELFSRGAFGWSHANPCPTAPPPNVQHALISGRGQRGCRKQHALESRTIPKRARESALQRMVASLHCARAKNVRRRCTTAAWDNGHNGSAVDGLLPRQGPPTTPPRPRPRQQ
jgi:hypothetical protein